jgi:hypothetical protein
MEIAARKFAGFCLGVHEMVQQQADGNHQGDREDEKCGDEPGGAAPGFVRGLGDAENVDEDGGEAVEQSHKSMVFLKMAARDESGGGLGASNLECLAPRWRGDYTRHSAF